MIVILSGRQTRPSPVGYCLSGGASFAPKHHAAMMEGVTVDEIAVGRKARIIPIFDVASGDFVASPVGAFPVAAGFVVAASGQKFVADAAIIRNPHADIGMLLHCVLACLLLLSFSVVHGIGGGRIGRRASQGDRREKLQEGAFENPSHCLAFRSLHDLD
ncbi:hypothetical protein GGE23_001521 [Rhizobium leguminosarum]|nr:hypothetical protein [Rhizobium leguminosarum]